MQSPFTKLRHHIFGIENETGRAAIALASENNWLRRFLYWVSAPRRWTRAV